MKQVILLGLLLSVFVGCTKYNQIDTGIAQKKYPGNMYEYFQSDSYNWDSLLLLIDYTGLKEYFTGEKEGYETITFFGPTNHSIRRWMYSFDRPGFFPWDPPVEPYRSMKALVDGVGVNACRDSILNHVVKGKYEVKDIPRGTSSDPSSGIIFTSATGFKFRVFSFQEPYDQIPEAGAVVLYLGTGENSETGIKYTTIYDIASTDIEPTNGIVHSMSYSYTVGKLK